MADSKQQPFNYNPLLMNFFLFRPVICCADVGIGQHAGFISDRNGYLACGSVSQEVPIPNPSPLILSEKAHLRQRLTGRKHVSTAAVGSMAMTVQFRQPWSRGSANGNVSDPLHGSWFRWLRLGIDEKNAHTNTSLFASRMFRPLYCFYIP